MTSSRAILVKGESSSLLTVPATKPTLRRVCSMPANYSRATRLNVSSTVPTSATANANKIDLLFSHSTTRIVSFTTTCYASFPPPAAASLYHGQPFLLSEQSENIPFISASERASTTGLLRLYKKKQNNSTFIQFGNAVHPLLSQSHAWCIHEERGIFCLRIRPGSYWRIEILGPEGNASGSKVAQFKSALAHAVDFETIPCPFRRLDDVSSPAVNASSLKPQDAIAQDIESGQAFSPAPSRCASPRPISRGRTCTRPSPALRIAHSRAASPQLTEANAKPTLLSFEGAFFGSRSTSPAIRASSVGPKIEYATTELPRTRIALGIETDFTHLEKHKPATPPSSFETMFSPFPSLSPDDEEPEEDHWPESILSTPVDDELSNSPLILGKAVHIFGATFIRSGTFLANLLSFPKKVATNVTNHDPH